MCRCIETIRIEHQAVCHLDWHQRRFDETRDELYPGAAPISLDATIRARFPDGFPNDGLFKLRLVYGQEVESTAVESYRRRSIRSLACVNGDGIEYRRKWVNRGALEALRESRPDSDDIIIVNDGMVTDSSYSNLAFKEGNRWVTPRFPLLAGSARARLVAAGRLVCEVITVKDLGSFSQVSLINAMNDIGDLVVPIDAVTGIAE